MANLKLNRPLDILVLPDSHAHPDYSNKRFDWFGELAADLKPDVIVDIGDLADMPSLCSYDKGTKGFEGRRYTKDIAAAVDAQERINAPIRRQKKKVPRRVRTLGNHEERINKAVSRDAVLDGVISVDDLQGKENGWEVYPFLEVVEIGGVHFSHYFTTGVMGRPAASARAMVMQQGASCVAGHLHTLDYHVLGAVDGRHRHGLICGVYQDFNSDYAGPANKLWRRGATMLRGVENGNYDFEWLSLERIKKQYGKQ